MVEICDKISGRGREAPRGWVHNGQVVPSGGTSGHDDDRGLDGLLPGKEIGCDAKGQSLPELSGIVSRHVPSQCGLCIYH